MNKTFAPKDERIVSTNPSPDTVITGPPRDVGEQLTASDAVADLNTMYPINTYVPPEQTYYYGGFDGNTSSWGAYPTYVGSDGLQPVSPVMFGDNPSLGLHPYGFNSQLAYGQYSPASVQPLMVDNQLFSPQQVSFSPHFYPQPNASSLPQMSPTLSVSQNEPTREGQLFVDTSQSSSFYHLPAIFTPAEHSSNQSSHADLGMRTLSPLGSMAAYTQSVGPFASYDPNMGQVSPQWSLPGFGVSNYMSGQYRYGGVQQNIKYANMASSQPGANYRYQLSLEKGRSQREQDSSYAASDRNRGPRATKVKGKSTSENSAPLSSKIGEATSETNTETYNDPHFPTEYQNAKFFIIKSFSEDNVHRSIKYSVWSSTPNGNRKLDAAFNEAKEKDNYPVFLFFSVNASAQFCGVAEMVGPVDFENSADYWQQDRWNGRFPVCWHFIKDVPNSKFRHILLENNENKPVTHSRDSQEVKLEQGLEMLRIFKDYEENTSILDDFDFYDERERVLKERKSRQFAKSSAEASGAVTDASINEISDRLDQGLRLDEKQGGSG
ncbi:YTH domain-containing protein, partial [Drosera capensis]